MTTVVLEGGDHGHEHFKLEETPTRILVQTEAGGGLYGRRVASVYQDTRQYENGCRVYHFVRSTNRLLDGLIETEYA